MGVALLSNAGYSRAAQCGCIIVDSLRQAPQLTQQQLITQHQLAAQICARKVLFLSCGDEFDPTAKPAHPCYRCSLARPKTTSTPSFSRQFTNSSAAFLCDSVLTIPVVPNTRSI